MSEKDTTTRRGLLASAAMGIGLIAAYGVLGAQGLLFLLPKRLKPRTRLIFAGRIDDYVVDGVKAVQDLQGTPILIKRTASGFTAFDATCPHLGCKVHWEADTERFFCPCHSGVFDTDGVATAGPPADAGQSLTEVPLKVDETAGVVYLEVKDAKRRLT